MAGSLMQVGTVQVQDPPGGGDLINTPELQRGSLKLIFFLPGALAFTIRTGDGHLFI